MCLNALFEKWDLKIESSIHEIPGHPSEADKDAFWEFYIELLIFITQTADDNALGILDGDIYSQHLIDRTNALCIATGKILTKHGRSCLHFSRVAGIFLNHIIRPFLGLYYVPGEEFSTDRFDDMIRDFGEMYEKLVKYAKLLADVLEVEDVIEIEMRCRAFG